MKRAFSKHIHTDNPLSVLFYLVLSCLLATAAAHAATDGTIPNQTYPANEQWTIISPQMSTRHINQPSVFNGYAILAGNAVHEVWDISDPYNPTFEAEMISNHAAGEAESHQVTYGRDENGVYYMATVSGRGIDIWDVSNTTSPTLTSELILPGINYGDVNGAIWGLSWQGNYVYAGATTNGLYIIDVSDPSNPLHVTTLTRSQLGGVAAGPVFALGKLLVVTTPKTMSGIATVDISDPINPILLDAYDPPQDSYIGGFYGTHAHFIRPFRSYDVTTDPQNITEIVSNQSIGSEYVSFADDYLYLGGLRGGTQGIWKYDITDLASPQLVGRVPGRDNRWDDQFSCPVGNLLIIADDQLVDNQNVGAVMAIHETEIDSKGPSVKWVSPANNSTKHPTSGQIGISLSEWPEFKSVDENTFIVRKAGGAPIPGKWGCTYTTLTFAPNQPLEPSAVYEIVLPAGGITDLVGNPIETTFISRFSTSTSITTGFPGNDDINPVPPVSLGSGSPFSLITPNPLHTYRWEFGDGNNADGTSATHVYSEPGRYFVRLETRDTDEVILEAEDASLEGGVIEESNNNNFTGTGFADYPSEEGANVKVVWNIEQSAAMTQDLNFRYALGTATTRSLSLVVNGGSPIVLDFTTTSRWTEWADLTVPDVSFVKGNNTIELRADAGTVGPNVDHLRTREATSNIISSFSFVHIVHNPLTLAQPSESKSLLLETTNIWVANADADTVSIVDTTTSTKTHEIAVGSEPKAIAQAPDSTIWVVCRKSWEIQVIDSTTKTVVDSINLPYASQPGGIAFSPDGSAAFVTLQALGQLIKLDPTTRTILSTTDFGPDSSGIVPNVRGIAINDTSDTVYVTRFISPDTAGEVYEVDAASMNVTRTIALSKSTGTDSSVFARGLPNYLTSISISPDGTRAWVSSKKDNIDRGGQLDGLELDHDVTVRAITSTINPASGSEVLSERIDHDNADRCHSATFSELGDLAFISFPGNDEIRIVDAYSGSGITILQTPKVPQDTILDTASGRLYVHNFLSRSLSIFDVLDIINGGADSTHITDIPLVSVEPLTPEVLRGKELFYNASLAEINQSGYLSCASCHLDGSQDGRIYDFTAPMQEGFRNTIDLRGRAGTAHGRVHWTANFDEIHDFEGQLRLLGKGLGLMEDSDFNTGTRSESLGDPKTGYSSDLDALAAYLESLDEVPPSPYRNPDGSLTADALAGKQHFNTLQCFTCHGGETFTDSAFGQLHDVGTLKATSGQRLGGTLTGIDTPTLLGIWDTAPYLHDGSAPTLEDVLTTANPTDEHGVVSTLNTTELNELVAYLHQIDATEPAAQPASGIGTTTFESFASSFGLTGDDALPLADPDGDGWNNLMEFTIGGTSLVASNDAPELIYATASNSTEDFFEISWLHRENGAWTGISYKWGDTIYTPQGSFDLTDWNEHMQIIPNPSDLPTPPSGYQWSTSRLMSPIQENGRGFINMSIEKE